MWMGLTGKVSLTVSCFPLPRLIHRFTAEDAEDGEEFETFPVRDHLLRLSPTRDTELGHPV